MFSSKASMSTTMVGVSSCSTGVPRGLVIGPFHLCLHLDSVSVKAGAALINDDRVRPLCKAAELGPNEDSGESGEALGMDRPAELLKRTD